MMDIVKENITLSFSPGTVSANRLPEIEQLDGTVLLPTSFANVSGMY